MKFRISFKSPNSVSDVLDAAAYELVQNIKDIDVKEVLFKIKRKKLGKFTSKWIKWNKYLTIEFDVENDTCEVVPVGSS